ncbi:MAG: AAA family ATPase [Candidatus Micrarchaeota archaeon]
MARIVITGSPGTGKSVISREVARLLSLEIIDLKRIARGRGLVGKGHEVDIRRLSRALSFLSGKRDYVVEGHLACELRIPADYVFVLRAHPSVLRRRLSRRGYGHKKLEENLIAEMLDYCTQRARAVYRRKPLELDTSRRTASSCAREIAEAIKQKKKKLDMVDYTKDLRRHLGLNRMGDG